MPGELVNEDYEITWIRADDTTRGHAQAFFASEWGEDFTDIRVTKDWFGPPAPMCDECCDQPATCGVEMNWGDGGPAFKAKVCDGCQRAVIARDGEIYQRLSVAEARTLEEVTPYDGWPLETVPRGTPGAVAYWHGEQR